MLTIILTILPPLISTVAGIVRQHDASLPGQQPITFSYQEENLAN